MRDSFLAMSIPASKARQPEPYIQTSFRPPISNADIQRSAFFAQGMPDTMSPQTAMWSSSPMQNRAQGWMPNSNTILPSSELGHGGMMGPGAPAPMQRMHPGQGSEFLADNPFQSSSPVGPYDYHRMAPKTAYGTPGSDYHSSLDRSHSSRGSRDSTAWSDTTSQTDDRSNTKKNDLKAKRMKKLGTLLETMNVSPPSKEEHNEKVRSLYNQNHFRQAAMQSNSLFNFAATLEKLSDASSTHSFVYGLLSREIFRQEEERKARDEKLSAIAASKAANKQMVECLPRRAKTRDWASDGRKAAKMVFNTLEHCGTAQRSFALLMLADNVSLDAMLKIAHFPATRERFTTAFAQIVNDMSDRWSMLSRNGYKTFDYERFIGTRGVCDDTSSPSSAGLSGHPAPSFNLKFPPSLQNMQLPFGTNVDLTVPDFDSLLRNDIQYG